MAYLTHTNKFNYQLFMYTCMTMFFLNELSEIADYSRYDSIHLTNHL